MYRIYTTKHDRIERAEDVQNPFSNTNAMHEWLNTAVKGGSHDAENCLNRFESLLSEISPDRGVTFLLDNSGSMRGYPAVMQVLAFSDLGQVMERAGLPFQILGHTSTAWKGGLSRVDYMEECRAAGDTLPDHLLHPGRLTDLRHIIYHDGTGKFEPRNLGVMLTEGFMKENIDGEALQWALSRADREGYARDAIVMVSDGEPSDQSTLGRNPSGFLKDHLRQVIHDMDRDPDNTLRAFILRNSSMDSFLETSLADRSVTMTNENISSRYREIIEGLTTCILSALQPDLMLSQVRQMLAEPASDGPIP